MKLAYVVRLMMKMLLGMIVRIQDACARIQDECPLKTSGILGFVGLGFRVCTRILDACALIQGL